MVNIGLFAEAIIKMKNGVPKEEAMEKLNHLDTFGLKFENIEKKIPTKNNHVFQGKQILQTN
jgi:hypothetical protein